MPSSSGQVAAIGFTECGLWRGVCERVGAHHNRSFVTGMPYRDTRGSACGGQRGTARHKLPRAGSRWMGMRAASNRHSIRATRPVIKAPAMTTVTINGKTLEVDAGGDTPLLWVLRDHLGMTGTKFGCGAGLCGACTVHLAGAAVRSCRIPLSAAQGASITTIEGIGADKVGAAVQAAWDRIDVPQCGYCQSGQVMAATALLTKNPKPTDADIDAALVGNLCRCGTYARIRAAIHGAAKSLEA